MPTSGRPNPFAASEPSAIPPKPNLGRLRSVRPQPLAQDEDGSHRTLWIVGVLVLLAGVFGMWRHLTRPAPPAPQDAGSPPMAAELRAMREQYGEADLPPEAVLRARARQNNDSADAAAAELAAIDARSASPALAAYEQAKQQISIGDMRAAVAALDTAIGHDSQFAEAWYQRGAAQTRLAIEAVRSSEDAAIDWFTRGVESKKRARALISAGETRVWTPEQIAQVNSDLQNALADVDQLLEDRATLVAALQLWAQSSR